MLEIFKDLLKICKIFVLLLFSNVAPLWCKTEWHLYLISILISTSLRVKLKQIVGLLLNPPIATKRSSSYVRFFHFY